MQLDGTCLSQAERNRRMKERRRPYCGGPDHFRFSCPELAGKSQPRPGEAEL